MIEVDSKSRRNSNWGRWGAEDEIGALNLLTPERVVAASRLVRTGRVYALGQSIQQGGVPMHWGKSPMVHFMARTGADYVAGAVGADDVGTADDYIGMATHGSTHIDALSHIWYANRMYNGFSPNAVRSSGAGRNSIDQVPPIVGRGVLLDVAGSAGVEHLPADYAIGPDELESASRRQGVRVGPGDVLLIRTGWYQTYAADAVAYHRQQPGLVEAAVPWIVDRDVVAVGADNIAVEQFPPINGKNVPVHLRLIRDYGIHLLELLVLEELAAARIYEFLFVAAPLRIKRGVGSPLNPYAIT